MRLQNEIAKRFGIVTAETVWQAKKKCPELVLVSPHHDRYAKYSKIVLEICDRFTDKVEPFGIDEAWLDVTGSLSLFGSGKDISDAIRETVKSEVGLTVSVGISFNKVFAKLGSDYKKPDATTVISRENYKEILYPLPVSALLYVGKSATATLAKLGIMTIGQLAGSSKALIVATLGKSGAMLHDYANGIDDSPVQLANALREVKSVGKGLTFKRVLIGWGDIRRGITPLAESIAASLRKHGLKCSAVQVSIRDPQFKTISRQKKLIHPTHLCAEIVEAAMRIMQESWKENAPIRMLTVTAINLVEENAAEQLSLFDTEEVEKRAKRENIEKTIDNIRGRFGNDAIVLGTTFHNDLFESNKTEDSED